MIGGFDDYKHLWLGERGDQGLELRFRGELVAGAAYEEFWFGAGLQEIVIVGAVVDGGDGRAQGDEGLDAWVGAGGAEADGGSKGEAGEDQREMEFVVEEVEGGADVVEFASAVVVLAVAESGAAEVEAEHRKAERVQSFHGVEDDFVVQRASVEGMGMTD